MPTDDRQYKYGKKHEYTLFFEVRRVEDQIINSICVD